MTEYQAFSVAYQNVAIQAKTARVTVKVSRDDVELEQADDLFADTRANVVLEATTAKGAQQVINSTLPEPLASVVDIKGYRVSADAFSVSLTFAKTEIDHHALTDFAQMDGELRIQRIGTAATAPADEEEEGDDLFDGDDEPEDEGEEVG